MAKCLVTKLAESVDNDKLPVLVNITEETRALLSGYSTDITEDMVYYTQKFFDSIGDSKNKIILMRCPCLATSLADALQYDLITGRTYGGAEAQSGGSWESSTRTLTMYRNTSFRNSNFNASDNTINNIGYMECNLTGRNQLTLSSGNWSSVGFRMDDPRGVLNHIEGDTIVGKTYSDGVFAGDKTSSYAPKDAVLKTFFDVQSSVSGAAIAMQGATQQEFEKVLAALIEFVKNINSCW